LAKEKKMLRRELDKNLLVIKDEVLSLGSMVEKSIARAMKALESRDLVLARQIISDDKEINKKRLDIEEKCIHLIVTQQPVASDLRFIVAVLNIIVELERIGDYSEGNARVALMIGDEPPLKPLVDLPLMAKKAADMLHRSLDAFINHDTDTATKICIEDDEVDNLYNQVFGDLIKYMVNDPKTITRATRLIWVAHNLERAADRVTNICERVVFITTGKMQEIAVSKY
jgi:phosphate transport system protein